MKYHPRIGQIYMSSAKVRVQGAQGGYLVRTNAAGFRSEREFVDARPDGVYRALLFGDSQTAGDGIANKWRYSDLLDAALPGLEMNNHAISGTATDQQYLAWQEHAHVQHDLLVIGVYVENILRITRRAVRARDADGDVVFRAKPYYERTPAGLVLRQVPVPKEPWTEASLPATLQPHVYSYGAANVFFRNHSRRHAAIVRALAPFGPLRRAAKQVWTRLRGYQPLPDYDRPDSAGWQLMRAILETWISQSAAPVLLVTLPHDSGLSGLSDPSAYQQRFQELAADTGCLLFDPLPAMRQLSAAARRELWSDAYGHLSAQGHATVARLMKPVIGELMSAAADRGYPPRQCRSGHSLAPLFARSL